jgi:CubicO group peptidase (beta-lactamase class C family)
LISEADNVQVGAPRLGFVGGAVCGALVCLIAAVADPVPVAAADKPAGLNNEKLAELRPALQKFVDDKQIAGAVVVVGRRGASQLVTIGYADVEKKTPMKPDTVFRIASMTKIVTAVGLMMLVDEGKLSVDDPVEKHLPEFRGQKLTERKSPKEFGLGPAPRPITVKDLITHTSGMQCSLPAGFTDLYRDKNRPLSEGVVAFSQHPLETAPGTKWRYCSPAYDTAGRVLEVVAGKPFEVFLSERLFRPLGMKDTTFRPTAQQRARLATLYQKAGDGADVHIVPAENQGVPGPPKGDRIVYASPSGGLYSTAPDYAKLMQMLLEGGSFRGRRYLLPETFAKMTSAVFASKERVGFTPGLAMGLGVQVVVTPTEVTEALGVGSFGHGGAYGTQAWVDPKNGAFYLLMIQRQGFGNGDMAEVRRVVQKIGASALAGSGESATQPPAAKPKG